MIHVYYKWKCNSFDSYTSLGVNKVDVVSE